MAVTISARFLVLAVAIAVAGLLLASCNAEPSVGACKGGGGVISKCQAYVMRGQPKKAPSADCCTAIRGADRACLCKEVTPAIGALIDIVKVCYVARQCGASVPPAGSKCGGLVIPKAC